MSWLRRRDQSNDDDFVRQANRRSIEDLSEAREMSREAREVSSRVRHQRELNHWSELVRLALGGQP